MTNQEKIKQIFLDYAEGRQWLEINISDLDIIAERIEKEVMNISDDNEFVSLKDIK